MKSRELDGEPASCSSRPLEEDKEVGDERHELGDIANDGIRFGQDLVFQGEVD